jgi:hypothetical protein
MGVKLSAGERGRQETAFGTTTLADDLGDRIPQRCLMVGIKATKRAKHEALFQGRKHRLDRRGLEKTCCVPLADPCLAYPGVGRN